MAFLPVNNIQPDISAEVTSPKQISRATSDFKEMLSSTIDEVNRVDLQGSKAIVDFSTGKDTNLHDVVLAIEEADMSIRMMVQFRNKALEAYNSIISMQI